MANLKKGGPRQLADHDDRHHQRAEIAAQFREIDRGFFRQTQPDTGLCDIGQPGQPVELGRVAGYRTADITADEEREQTNGEDSGCDRQKRNYDAHIERRADQGEENDEDRHLDLVQQVAQLRAVGRPVGQPETRDHADQQRLEQQLNGQIVVAEVTQFGREYKDQVADQQNERDLEPVFPMIA